MLTLSALAVLLVLAGVLLALANAAAKDAASALLLVVELTAD
jgi:uncharacterized protein YjeT (DUF2065 family)